MDLKKMFTMVMLFFITVTFAQSKKLDKIIKKDYEVIECTITKMSDTTVEYSLPNETMITSLEVSKIAKIDFASGRTQTFDVSETASQTQTVNSVSSPAALKANTIAVLPVPYVNSENLSNSEEMAKFAQSDIYNKHLDKLSNIFPLTVQDLRDTNSLLRKAGLDYKNIDEASIDELQKILGVDNIIAAKVSYNIGQNQTANTYSAGTVQAKSNTKVTDQNFSTTNTSTDLIYNFHVYFDLYKNGSKIYTQSREPVLKSKDSWMDSVSYLLKRSTIYVKK